VAVVVRDGEAIPPRGSTVIASGDRLYVLSRKESRRKVEKLFEAWR
jgi:cell volume regulation protein A